MRCLNKTKEKREEIRSAELVILRETETNENNIPHKVIKYMLKINLRKNEKKLGTLCF